MDFDRKEELWKKGKSALDVGRLDEAEGFFNEILAEEPEEVDVLNKMGVVWIYRKDKEKAKEYFEKCLEINPEHAPALTNMANLILEEGDMNKAEMLYRQAIRFDPKFGSAHNNLAHILKKTGRVQEAVKHMKKAQRSGAMSWDFNSPSTKTANTGCLVIIGLSVLALILWLLTR